jgi:sterol desaturase/sphingolipid hydroxylase (fatty acid hydroxylase superfamily)
MGLESLPKITNGSELNAMLLICGVALSAIVLGATQRRDEKLKQLGFRERCVSHPLFTWVLENACCVLPALLSMLVVPQPKQGSFASAAFSVGSGALISEVMHSMSLTWLTQSVYHHVALFSEKGRPKISVLSFFQGWLSCHLWVDSFNAFVLGAQIASLNFMSHHQTIVRRDFSPLKFLLKYGILRIFTDIGFWFAHRALHHRSLYWLHKKHHQHSRPSITTNYHFHPLDFWFEAIFPASLGFMALQVLNLQPGRFEQSFMLNYIIFHAVSSHAGKPLPCVTYFPPLAPLYQLLLGPVDRDNIKHHDVHHARLDCNYSIVIWPDIVMGTRVVDHRDPLPSASKKKCAPSEVGIEGPQIGGS